MAKKNRRKQMQKQAAAHAQAVSKQEVSDA